MDHGVRDPDCDHCKRGLGPLYHHKIKGNRHLPVFTFDFSGPHPHRVNVAQSLLVSVWSLGHVRLIWAFSVESRQASVVLPCLQSCFEDLRALTGPPILRLHSDKAREFLSPTIREYLSQQGVRQTVNSGSDPQGNGLAEQWIGIVKVRIGGGVLVVSAVNGELKEVCSAKVRALGEKVGQAWRLHVHPQDTSKAAYVNRKGEVKWNLQEVEAPTVEQCVREDDLGVQDIRELGLGWAWFVNDLRAFLPAWQDMALASPVSHDPVTQIEADIPIEPLALQAEAPNIDHDMRSYGPCLRIASCARAVPATESLGWGSCWRKSFRNTCLPVMRCGCLCKSVCNLV